MNNVTAIIPAAGPPTNRIIYNSTLPNTMIPLDGKPIISYLIEDLLARSIVNIAVILNSRDIHTEKFIRNKYQNKANLQVIYTDHNRGLGYTIALGLNQLKLKDKILIILGDTLYKGNLELNDDFLIYSTKFDEPEKWCFVKKVGKTLVFINKPTDFTGLSKILTGIYFFINKNSLKKAANICSKKLGFIELSDILEEYQKSHHFKLLPAEGWYDVGNIENYYKAKIYYLKIRSFNRVKYNPLFGTITKYGTNSKIINEINWYLKAPEQLKIFFPRLYDYKINTRRSNYSLEFYGYQSLADMYTFSYLNIRTWESIIKRLFEIVNLFKQYKGKSLYKDFKTMYYQKTLDRLSDLKSNYWQTLMSEEEIIINTKPYKNVKFFLPLLEKHLKLFFNEEEISFIHGDMCLSNILYDTDNKLIKFIDPRGSFGTNSIYGDIKYDIAKLRHSFCSYYDFIVSDLFYLNQIEINRYSYYAYTDEIQEKVSRLFDQFIIKNNFNLKTIKLIEALLFVSMIPLHQDSIERQKAMYLTGIILLNNTFNEYFN